MNGQLIKAIPSATYVGRDGESRCAGCSSLIGKPVDLGNPLGWTPEQIRQAEEASARTEAGLIPADDEEAAR